MNLANNPTEAKLKTLIEACNDSAAHHMVWVSNVGEVHIDPFAAGVTPSEFALRHRDDIRFRYETYALGNGYTGSAAADDPKHVRQLFISLMRDWNDGSRGYIGC